MLENATIATNAARAMRAIRGKDGLTVRALTITRGSFRLPGAYVGDLARATSGGQIGTFGSCPR